MNPPSTRLKIAVLNRTFAATGGGAERYSMAIVAALGRDHEVHVFAQKIEGAPAGLHLHRVSCPLPKPRWINQLWFAAVTAWRTRHGFDVVHSHENTWGGQIHTIHVQPVRFNLLAGRSRWRWALRWLKIGTSLRLLAYLALEAARFRAGPRRRVVVTSEALREEVLQAYPHAQPWTSVITPGVNPPGEGPEPAMARTQLGLPPQVPLALFVANDYARKGLEAVLQALAEPGNDWHLAVVGQTGGQAIFSVRSAQLGVADRVHFLGPLPDVGPAYRAADLLVHPTLADTFAMVVLEAMAHGRPVVVSNARFCGISALIRHQQQAWLLDDPRNASSLADAMQALRPGSLAAVHLAACAKEWARGHDWSVAANAYLDLIEQVRPLRPPV
jgi:glycosyltransferase involved in cell wall biosynthesis